MPAPSGRIPITLIAVGEPEFVGLDALARKLNGLNGQTAFEFRTLPSGRLRRSKDPQTDYIPVDDLAACAKPPFYTDKCILDQVDAALGAGFEQSFIVAITSLRLTRGQDDSYEPLSEDDYFGTWGRESTRPERPHGVISLALWLDRYEARSLRTPEQYIAYMLVAFLGDVIFVDRAHQLTHLVYRRCVFDFNDDLDSIVGSIQRSAMCSHCKEDLTAEDRPLRVAVDRTRLVKSFEALLKFSQRPTWRNSFRSLINRPWFSLLVISVVLGLTTEAMGSLLTDDTKLYAAISLVVLSLVLIGGAVVYERTKLGRLFQW